MRQRRRCDEQVLLAIAYAAVVLAPRHSSLSAAKRRPSAWRSARTLSMHGFRPAICLGRMSTGGRLNVGIGRPSSSGLCATALSVKLTLLFWGSSMRRHLAVPLPKGVFRIRKKSGLEYWYHQANRGAPAAGPLSRLPEYGKPEFWRAIAKLTETPMAEGSIQDVVNAYKASARFSALAENSRKTYEFALTEVIAAWGKLHAQDITPAGVAALVDSLSERPGIANLTLSVVRVLMREAVRKGYRTDNPAREIEGISKDVDGARPLTAEAWQSLMQAPEDVKRLAILGRATGQRISDLVSMSPRMRDQDGITTGIQKIKERSHWCPLTQEQIATLDGWNVFKNAAYSMRPDGKRHTTNSARMAWNEWLATEEGEPCRGFTPHDLRATKVCDERIAGTSHQQISAMIGMSLGMVMRYSKHIDKRLVARGSGTRTERDL